MRFLIRGIIHLLALVLLIAGLVLLCASIVSIWRTPGVFVRFTLFPNETHQHDNSLVIAVESGRLVFDQEYCRYEGKFGPSSPEFDYHAGLGASKPLGGSFISNSRWFSYDKIIWPDGLSIHPLSTHIAQNTVLIPAPLAASILMIVSLWWLVPAINRWFRIRIRTNLCLHCNYNLTGVEGDTCPECGAPRPLATISSS